MIALLVVIFLTSFVSGMFGMAGGLILMGVMLSFLPAATAMVWHGAVQFLANGWRAFLLRSHIRMSIVRRYMPGALAGATLAMAIGWRPDKESIFAILGLTALTIWLPVNVRLMDVERRGRAEICGLLVQNLHITAGAAGPVFDMFFVETDLTRQEIVATKSCIQALSHILKIIVWGPMVIPLLSGKGVVTTWLVVATAAACMTGTLLGGVVLRRMSEVAFRQWLRLLITLIGIVFLIRAI